MRALFRSWAEEAGYGVTVDRLGNMFVRRAGTEDGLPPVLVGSHLDTQAAGGRFDGILGVMAGLEILRALADAGLAPRRSIDGLGHVAGRERCWRHGLSPGVAVSLKKKTK